MREKITIKTQAHPEGRKRGSGTGGGTGGGGGGGRGRGVSLVSGEAQATCNGPCGTKTSPTGAGTAVIRIRHARPIVCCVDCATTALAAIGITLEVIADEVTTDETV